MGTPQKIKDLKQLWKKVNPNPGLPANNKQFDIVEQIGSFFASGSYYYYILDFNSLQFEFVSPGIKEVLGMHPDEFTVEKLLGLYHPEDLEKMHGKEALASEFLFEKLEPAQIVDYKVVYLNRLKAANGTYKKVLHQAQALNVSDDGKIQRVIGVHTDISYLNSPIDHKVSLISSKYPSYYALSTSSFNKHHSASSEFTKRELEIILQISQGYSTKEIAENLFIASETVKSHKKNILKKKGVKNATHLVTECIREGII